MQLFASYGPDILHFLSSLQSAFSSAGVNCIAKKIFVSFSWDPCNISTCTIKINHLCRSVKYTIPVDAMGFGSPSDMSLWHVDSWHTGGAQIPLTDGLIGVSGWSAQGPTRPGSDLKTPHCKFVKKMEVKSIFSDVFCHASENPYMISAWLLIFFGGKWGPKVTRTKNTMLKNAQRWLWGSSHVCDYTGCGLRVQSVFCNMRVAFVRVQS